MVLKIGVMASLEVGHQPNNRPQYPYHYQNFHLKKCLTPYPSHGLGHMNWLNGYYYIVE